MDIRSGIIATIILLALFAVFSFWRGMRTLQSARKMTFYRLRRQREAGGWRLLGLAIILVALAIWLPLFGEPIAYDYFPPSPTPSLTPTVTIVPTITLSPTITLTPTITDTPAVTDTPTITPTPFLPLAMQALFQSSVTPNPGAIFSPLLFSTKLNNSQAVDPTTVFQNPVGHMYAAFSYDQMSPGAQWTALWIRNGEIVHYETKPWDGATGGFGFTDWNPTSDQWLAGKYEVQVFVGLEWKVVGRFLVQGDPPTAVPTITPTATATPSRTRTPTLTVTSSSTPTSSKTPLPTKTSAPSSTPKPTSTPKPSATPSPTRTP
ncbi:MAG: hypothetical protein HYX49_01345 [Chloroflexi bacterium]|nr:hypothetical protein [Chloroflexota bacterium]